LNNKRKALEKRLTDGRNQITKALEPIVKDIIDKKKLQVVIDRGALFYAAESLNITEEALAALDAKLPKV
jgi:Skp family chaperone for outer membrane proteins